jgi:RNA polymerase sigma factor (sigma-70 family)
VVALGNGNGIVASSRNAVDLLTEFTRTGRQEAFEEVVRRYAAMVFGVCLKTTRNAHDAEDATQAVFLNLATHCKTSGQPITYVGPWLQKVARRVSLDIRRSKKRRQAREETHATTNGNGHAHGVDDPGQAGVDVDELKAVLNDELHQLPAKYRLPMILHYYGGLTREEIARELGCKASTLGVRIHRGRQMLAKRLEERGASPVGMSLGVALTVAVRDAVSDGMIASTSKAAAELMAGKQLGAMISSHVLAVAHGAIGTAMIAKLKTMAAVIVVAALTLAGTAGALAKVVSLEDLKLQWPVSLRGIFRIPRLQSPFRAPQARANDPAAPGALELAAQSAAADAVVQAVFWLSEQDADSAPTSHRMRPNGTPSRSRRGPGYTPAGRLVAQLISTVVHTSIANRAETSKPAPADDQALASARPLPPTSNEPPRRPAAPASPPAEPPAPRGGGFGGAVVSTRGSVVMGRDKSVTLLRPPSRMSGAARGTGGAPARPAPNTAVVRGPSMTLGAEPGSRGAVTLKRGVMDVAAQVIGEKGHGELTQDGGVNIAQAVRMGVEPGSTARYDVKGNRLLIKGSDAPVALAPAGSPTPPPFPVLNGIEVGHAGDATFNLGDSLGMGEVSELGASGRGGSLVVRGDSGGSGTFTGTGRVRLSGFFNHSGRVIADGLGQDRSLEFEGFRYVGNNFDNPAAGGTNGWFARNHGRLVLPVLRVRQGTHTYTWGDDPSDPTIDLVNSVRLTVHDAADDAPVRVALLSRDHGDVPALPQGHNFIGVWEYEAGTQHGAVDLIIRYDDALAAHLGLDENNLKLWRYDDGQWLRINDETFFRDVNQNLIGGQAPSMEFFAVSAPEPSTAAVMLLGGAALLLRRRRGR